MKSYKKRKIETILEKYVDSPEAIVVTGFRRVGKTSLVRYIFENLTTSNKIFLDLESPVNQQVFRDQDYENIKLKLSSLGLDFSKKVYIFLDEIQQIKEIPSIVKYLSDHYQIKFFLTGSSSFYLKNYFSESMAGRKFIFEMLPLDFSEFLEFKDSRLTTEASYDLLIGLYEEYLQFGGFPSVVLANSAEEKQLKLDDVLGSYFELDVKNLADFRNNQNLKDLLFLLSSRVGNKADVTRLAEALGVSRATVYEYLDFFEQTYLIHFLRPFSRSTDVQIRSLPKLYFNDSGILNRVGSISRGQLLENKIFNQLLLRQKLHSPAETIFSSGLAYYQMKSGAEIDFVVDERQAYEVKVLATQHDWQKTQKISERLNLTPFVLSLQKPRVEFDGLKYPFSL